MQTRQNHNAPLQVLALLPLCAFAVACNPEKCPGDQWEYDARYGACAMAAPPQGDGDSGDGDSGDGDGGDGDDMPDSGMPDEAVPFGADCSDDADCGPGICVNDPIMLGCTQISCMAGEDNAGICPSDWMCFADPSSGGSACVKF